MVTALRSREATPQLVSDYTTLLRRQLLPVPEYCRKAGEGTYSSLVGLFCELLEGLEREAGASPEEAGRLLATLAELLHHCPYDLEPDQWDQLLQLLQEELQTALGGAGGGLPDVRLLQPLMAALNAFLLRFGTDAAHATLHLAPSLVPAATRVWGSPHALPRLKEDCFLCARALLRLGTLAQVPGALKALLASALAEAQRRAADVARVNREERPGRAAAPPAAAAARGTAGRLLMELLAELWAHRARGEAGWTDADVEDEEDEELSDALPRKRARQADEWTIIFDSACSAPAALLPALALLLHRCAAEVPRSARVAAVTALWRFAEAGLRGAPGTGDATVTLWALRCLRELAASERQPPSAHAAAPELDDVGDVVDAAAPVDSQTQASVGVVECAKWAEVRAAPSACSLHAAALRLPH